MSGSSLVAEDITYLAEHYHWKSQIIEGIGNEVVITLIAFSLIACALLLFICKRVTTWTIDQAFIGQVNNARSYINQSDRFLIRDRSPSDQAPDQSRDQANHDQQPHYGMDTQCPVCLNEPRLPIETNCGKRSAPE